MEEIRLYNAIDSTNVEAQRLLTNPSIIPHGTTLVAREQTGGKGQLGRPWHSAPGQHLAMTIILKPQATPQDLPRFSKMISLAICMVLENLDPAFQPRIKWPNDIYLHGKKVAGILIENALAGNRIQHIIAGIGMNVNETAFPPELPNAVSLRMISGKEFDILEIAKSIQEKILSIIINEPRGREAQAGGVLSGVEAGTDSSTLHANSIQREKSEGQKFEGQKFEGQKLETEYSSRLFMKNQIAAFDQQGKTIHGEIQDVDDQGRLILRIDEKTHSYYTHEIKWII